MIASTSGLRSQNRREKCQMRTALNKYREYCDDFKYYREKKKCAAPVGTLL